MTLVDWVKNRGGDERDAKQQDRAHENFSRNVPAMIRDGKDIRVTFDASVELTVNHGLNRIPKGWFIHSAGSIDPKGSETPGTSAHSIIEVSKSNKEIRLLNAAPGASALTAMLWIW